MKQDMWFLLGALLISSASVWYAWAQNPTHQEQLVDPVSDLHGRVAYGSKPDLSKPCDVEKEFVIYPVVHVIMPAGTFDRLHFECALCFERHWRPLEVKPKGQ
jgi:hypothetical protein